MRILQVITSLGTGGAEKLLVDSIPLYKEKGVDMELLLLNGTEFPFFKKLSKKGIKIYHLGKGNIKTVYNPLHIFHIIPFLKKYDVIHVHLFPTLYWVALAKCISRSKTKLIFTEHNTHNRRMNNPWLCKLDNFVYRKYSKIVCITEQVYKNISSCIKIDNSKFCVIHNGIDISKFEVGEKAVDKTEKIIMQISSFRKQKDQETVIRSMQYLHSDIKLILVGDGSNRINCENLASKLNLSDRVLFLGVRMDIPQLLKSANISILSSNYEGLSLSSIECMASGAPFIASDVPGLNELVKGAGILFPLGDEKALANCIQKLLGDKTYYNQVAAACKNRANQYDINLMVDKYIDLYESVCK